MILLPDEDDLPVDAQVNAVIGEALRQSVAAVEPSAGFAARLAAALDAVAAGGDPAQAGARDGAPADEAARGAGQGSETAETAS